MKSVYGTWKVTTEGDVEGKSTDDLGVWEGFIDEIALYLANKSYYKLEFVECEIKQIIESCNPTQTEVHVSIRNKPNKNIDLMQKYFNNDDRKVHILKSNYCDSFVISIEEDPEVIKQIAKDKALSKLTKKDRKALGV